ncbi:AmmeMemoRadiSam system protein B [Candidatus Uhrbacteria bacterium]|nr:AmmeMemoRadiSam system protein B [Candidatus Uhrbacteria bacterium]
MAYRLKISSRINQPQTEKYRSGSQFHAPFTSTRAGVEQTDIISEFTPINASIFLDKQEFYRVFSKPITTIPIQGKVIAATVNHHVLATDLLAQFFVSLAKNRPDATRLVILSPDHFFAGRGKVSTHERKYQTPDGLVEIDAAAIESLVKNHIANVENGTMYEREHGIGALMPFVKKSFPKATIVPISIQGKSDIETLFQVSRALTKLDDGRTLFIVSADMSHYLSKEAAVKNDIQTKMWLEKKDEQAMIKAKDTHTDSGRQFVTLFHWLNQVYPKSHFQLIGQGISSDYVADIKNTTSYINGVWSIK